MDGVTVKQIECHYPDTRVWGPIKDGPSSPVYPPEAFTAHTQCLKLTPSHSEGRRLELGPCPYESPCASNISESVKHSPRPLQGSPRGEGQEGSN